MAIMTAPTNRTIIESISSIERETVILVRSSVLDMATGWPETEKSAAISLISVGKLPSGSEFTNNGKKRMIKVNSNFIVLHGIYQNNTPL